MAGVAAAAVIGAAATGYSVHQQKKMAEQQSADQAALEKSRQAAMVPNLPDTEALGASLRAGQIQAQSAGGTILSDPKKNAQSGVLGSAQNTGQNTLLGG